METRLKTAEDFTIPTLTPSTFKNTLIEEIRFTTDFPPVT